MPAMHGMLSFLAGQKLEDINDILVAVDPDNAGGKLVNKNFWIIGMGGRGRIESVMYFVVVIPTQVLGTHLGGGDGCS